MSLIAPHATIKKFAETQGKETILETIGNLDSIKVMQNMVLVATYIRPDKTKSGLYLPDSAVEEDIYQGKVGLILKLGPTAFEDEQENRFGNLRAKEHDWCVYRVGDSWDLTIRNVHCRLIRDDNIRLVINDPEEIF